MKRFLLPLLPLAFVLGGCMTIRTEHEVKPIHITMDVNVKMTVEKALNDVFGDLDKSDPTLKSGAK
jgi:uncharacterized protein YceK